MESFWSGINERVASGEIVRASGSLTAQASYNYFATDGDAVRRNAPYTWGVHAAASVDVLGIQAPFSLAVASRNTRYQLPSYQFAGASPTYKWITLHGGDRSMAFSPYSLSGVNFRGGGFEITPGKWYVAGMYGRLRTDRVEDAGAIQSGLTIDDYRRFGHGAKVGFAPDDASEFTASYFGSADRFGASPDADSLSALGILPERNAVLTVAGSRRITDLVSLEVEAARSVLTRDDNAAELPDAEFGLSLGGLLTPRTSTSGASAFAGVVTFAPAFARFQVKYERIDPAYRTHGSLFFQNDMENVTAGVTAPLFAKRLTLAVNGGLQRNDLRGDQAAELRRAIGSVAVGLAWREGVSTSFSASNFATTNRYRTLDLTRPLVDSVVLAQSQLSLTATHAQTLNSARTQSLVLTGSYQRAQLIRDERVDTTQGSAFLVGSVTWSLQPASSDHGWTAGLLANRTATPQTTTLIVGPSVGWQMRFAEEAGTLSARASYNLTRVALEGPAAGAETEATSTGRLAEFGLTGGYQLTERQRVSLTGSYVLAGDSGARAGYSDVQVQVGYGISLSR